MPAGRMIMWYAYMDQSKSAHLTIEKDRRLAESSTNLMLDGNEELQVARIVGACWHGYKVIGPEPAIVLYGVTKLYDYDSPDEQRRTWDDESIVPTSLNGKADDPRNGRPYNWNVTPRK